MAQTASGPYENVVLQGNTVIDLLSLEQWIIQRHAER